MSEEQQFDLFLAAGQAVVGVVVTVIAVYIAARLAFRAHRRQAVIARSRESAEKLMFGILECGKELTIVAGIVNFVIQPKPATIGELDRKGYPIESFAKVTESFKTVANELVLISDQKVRSHVKNAHLCALDFELTLAAVTHRPDDFTPDDLATVANHAASYLMRTLKSLECYLKNEKVPDIAQPNYWKTPISRFA